MSLLLGMDWPKRRTFGGFRLRLLRHMACVPFGWPTMSSTTATHKLRPFAIAPRAKKAKPNGAPPAIPPRAVPYQHGNLDDKCCTHCGRAVMIARPRLSRSVWFARSRSRSQSLQHVTSREEDSPQPVARPWSDMQVMG